MSKENMPGEDPTIKPLADIMHTMGCDPDGTPRNQQSPEQIKQVSDVETAMQYVGAASERGFGAFFGSIVRGEQTMPVSSEEDGLAAYDSSSSAQSMQFEVEFSTEYLRSSLAQAGLRVSAQGFRTSLHIADGARLVTFLDGLGNNASDTLKSGLERTVTSAFTTIMLAHVPSMFDENFEHYHKNPMLLPEVNAGIALAESYGPQTDQLILHGHEIAEAMEDLGCDEHTSERIKTLHQAATEGKIGEWAVAYDWGLLSRPNTRWSVGWQQWIEHSEWEKVFELVDGAVARSPEGSPFIRGLIDRMTTNITDLRNGNLRYVEAPPRPDYGDDEDDVVHLVHDFDTAADAPESSTYLDPEHDALLQQVTDRLRQYTI